MKRSNMPVNLSDRKRADTSVKHGISLPPRHHPKSLHTTVGFIIVLVLVELYEIVDFWTEMLKFLPNL